MASLNVLVLGASLKPHRYANMAIRSLAGHGHKVTAVGLQEGIVSGIDVLTVLPAALTVHTVTLYLNEQNQRPWEERILGSRPQRIIFNPGAENPRLHREAKEQGIEVMNACTLVMLNTDQF